MTFPPISSRECITEAPKAQVWQTHQGNVNVQSYISPVLHNSFPIFLPLKYHSVFLAIIISAPGSPTWVGIPCLQKMSKREIIITVLFLARKPSQACSHSAPLVLDCQFVRVKRRTNFQSMGGMAEGICASLSFPFSFPFSFLLLYNWIWEDEAIEGQFSDSLNST